MAKTDKPMDMTWDNVKDSPKLSAKWNSKKEFNVVKKVWGRMIDMEDYKKSSCPWVMPDSETAIDDNGDESSYFDSGIGSDWKDCFDNSYKLWSMWHDIVPGRSNLKSPISFAPVEAALADFISGNNVITFTAPEDSENDDDDIKAEIYQALYDSLRRKGNFKDTEVESFHECLITGTCIEYNGYIYKASRKTFSKKKDELLKGKTDEEKEKLLTAKKPETEKKLVVEYDDIGKIHVSNYEFYVDPGARCLRGYSYEAADCIWRQSPTVEQVKSEFSNSFDPYVIKENIKSIKKAKDLASDYDGIKPFFRILDTSSNKVDLIRYYSKADDKYIVIANDVIIRNGPLPYDHKQLPFTRGRFFEYPGLFWGIGIPTLLESLQSEDETIRNMALDQLKIILNPPIFISSDIFEDVDSGWDRIEPGLKVEVSGSVGQDNIRFMPGSEYRPEVTQTRNALREDSIMTSGINPITYSLPQQNEAVRNNIMTNESSQKMIKKGIYFWSQGQIEGAKQDVMLMKQFYPEDFDVETIKDESGKEMTVKKYKSIKLNGKEIFDDNGKLSKKSIEGKSRLEILPEYLDIDGDLEVWMDTDSILPPSKALMLQNLQQALTILPKILSTPTMLEAPGMTELIRDYVRELNLSEKIIDSLASPSTEAQIALAIEQESQIISGATIAGIPGESDNHKLHHISTLLDLLNTLQDPNVSMAEKESIRPVAVELAEHIKTDNMPKYVAATQVPSEVEAETSVPSPMGVGGPTAPGARMGENYQVPSSALNTGGAGITAMPNMGMPYAGNPQMGM